MDGRLRRQNQGLPLGELKRLELEKGIGFDRRKAKAIETGRAAEGRNGIGE
jgi:hypothetical protein